MRSVVGVVTTLVVSGLLIVAAACTGTASSSSSAPSSGASSDVSSISAPVAKRWTLQTAGPVEPVGPLAGLRWPAGKLPRPPVLLHDDGTTLWAVPLHGSPQRIWTHPKIGIVSMAADVAGHQLAYSVLMPFKNPSAPFMVVYLLQGNGRIKTVDVTRHFDEVDSLMFARSVTAPRSPPVLSWIRSSENVSRLTNRIETQAMTLVKGVAHTVQIPLRYGESALELASYPGAVLSSLLLIRTANNPTRYEAVVQAGRLTSTVSPTHWDVYWPSGDTDDSSGPAWLTGTTWLVPLTHDSPDSRAYFSLRLYNWNCMYTGSERIRPQYPIDANQDDSGWQIQPVDPTHALVLRQSDVNAFIEHRDSSVPWYEISIPSGRMTATAARWDQAGAWTITQPARNPLDAGTRNCSAFRTYP